MSLLTDTLEEKLAAEQLDLRDFQSVCQRLMGHQVLCADHSKTESDLYNLFRRMEGILDEYLGLLGFTLYHDARGYVLLFAPGVNSPMLQGSELLQKAEGLRRKLAGDTVKLILLLRYHYDEALKSGTGIERDGSVVIAVQSLNQSFQTLMRTESLGGAERNQAFKEAESLRLVEAREEQWNNPDGWIRIRPVITATVFSDMVTVVAEALAGVEDEDALSDDREDVA